MSTENLKLKIITTTDEFSNCADRWNELAGDSVFHRWEWMFSWWEVFQHTGQLAIVVITDRDDRWLGVAPWFKTNTVKQGRVIRTLASGAACSDYTSLAIRPTFEQAVTSTLAEIISGEEDLDGIFADVDVFEIEAHTGGDQGVQCLREHLEFQSIGVQSEEFAATWRAELPTTWSEFQSRLHKSFRRKTKKAAKRLEDPDFQTSIARTPEQINELWGTFVDLHQRRRQSLNQPGCFADNDFERFLRFATIRLSEYGLAKINLVSHGGRPLATSLEFVSGDSVLMYQTGMDPEQLDLEPGHIIFTYTIQHSIEQRFTWFDFLRGDEPYKSRWKAQRFPLYRTKIVPRRLKSVVRHGIYSAGKNVKSWTKSVLSKT